MSLLRRLLFGCALQLHIVGLCSWLAVLLIFGDTPYAFSGNVGVLLRRVVAEEKNRHFSRNASASDRCESIHKMFCRTLDKNARTNTATTAPTKTSVLSTFKSLKRKVKSMSNEKYVRPVLILNDDTLVAIGFRLLSCWL